MATPRPRRSAASSSAFLGQEDEDSSRDNSPISAADMALRSARKRGRGSASHTPRKRASPQMSALGIETTPRAPSSSSSSAAVSGTRRRRSLSQPPSASVIRQEVRKSLAAAATPMARRAGGPPSARQSLAAFQQDLRLASTPGPSSFLRTPGRGVGARDTPGFLDTVRRNKELHQSASKRPAVVKSTPFAATHGIGGWGAGIGESPMDLLVQLAMAPGVLPEPTPRERPAPSFVRPGLRNIPRRNASLRPGEPVPGDLTRDDGDVAGDVSTSSALGNEQARQRRRQSTRSSNIFAELLQDEGTTLLTPASNVTRNRPSLFSIGEPSGLRDDDGEEEDVFGSALGREGEDRSGMMNAFANALEGFNDDDSTRLSLTRAMSEPTTVGFNDVGADVDFLTGDGDAFGEERAASITAFNEDEQDTPRSSAPRPSDTDLVDTSRLVPSDVLDKSLIYQYDESDEDIGEVGAEDPDASSSSASEDGDALTRQQVRKAQMGLLRRRVARRKRSRKSPITGKPTPMLPPTTVRRLFDAAVQPSKGSLSGGPTVAKRQTIALENGVVDAVEEATHEFLAEFTRQVSDVARQHGRSRTVTEQDAMAVIKAHGFATPREPIPTLARRYLPRELSDLLVGCLSTPMANSALAVAPGPSSPSSSGSSASYSPTKKRTAKGKGKARGRR